MRRLAVPALVLALSLVAWGAKDLLARAVPGGRIGADGLGHWLAVVVWIAATFLVVRGVDAFLRHRIRRAAGRRPPDLLVDLVNVALWMLSVAGLSTAVFGASVSGAVATSSVVLAVVGFALRDMISDVFYGITMALERPFEIGDWIETAEGLAGRVDEFSWRAVKLITAGNVKIILPNSQVARSHCLNYDQPDPAWRTSLRITLGYDVSTDQVSRLLLSAVEQVGETASLPHQPDARIVEYLDHGITWELRFWVPDFPSSTRVAHEVHVALLHNLRLAGLSVPRQREEVYLGSLADERTADAERTRSWIEWITCFSPLAREERESLRAGARRVEVEAGTQIVKEGEEGDSLFAVVEGALAVRVSGDAVATLRPGDVFGEMSLLTGASRSATVVAAVHSVLFEITKDDVEPLLRRHPDLAEQIGEVAARRLADNERRAEEPRDEREREPSGTARYIAVRIRQFFKI